jgi:hypothetical protein
MEQPTAVSTKVVPQNRIAALADEPGNTVYAYTYDTPAETMSAEEQEHCVRQICAAFDAATVAFPTESDEALRERVLRGNERVRLFQRTHARTFASITERVHTAAAVKQLDLRRKMAAYMIKERQVGEGTDDDKASRVMAASFQLSLVDTPTTARADAHTTVLPLETQLDDRTIREARETAARAADTLRALGGCVVRQPFTLQNGAAQ